MTTDLVPVRRTGVVDNAVYSAELLINELQQRLPVFSFGDIALVEFALQLASRLLASILDEVGYDDLRTVLDEQLGDSFAKTTGSACHYRDFVRKLAWHCVRYMDIVS